MTKVLVPRLGPALLHLVVPHLHQAVVAAGEEGVAVAGQEHTAEDPQVVHLLLALVTSGALARAGRLNTRRLSAEQPTASSRPLRDMWVASTVLEWAGSTITSSQIQPWQRSFAHEDSAMCVCWGDQIRRHVHPQGTGFRTVSVSPDWAVLVPRQDLGRGDGAAGPLQHVLVTDMSPDGRLPAVGCSAWGSSAACSCPATATPCSPAATTAW